MKLSICIPTYNRARHLANCLQSIIANKSGSRVDFQLCISDNCSTDETESVVRHAQESMEIKYQKNSSNLGMAGNFLNVVDMADGEFVWIIGDDDLLLPGAIEEIAGLIKNNPEVEYFCVNSSHLTTEFVFSYPQPFNIVNLPEKMEPFCFRERSGEMKFMDLIDPKVSFDFLGGIFLSVFKRVNWLTNANVVDQAAVANGKLYSHFDNTFPHIKIFATAFAHSKAYYYARPLSVCLTGAREWAPMYSFIRSVRLVEALDEYRKNGMPYMQYLRCKNFALRTFLPDMAYIVINKKNSGFIYLKPLALIRSNLLYPNLYFSVVYFIARKIRSYFKSIT